MPPLSSPSRAALLDAARAAFLAAFKPDPVDLAPAPPQFPELSDPCGCFVSLHERDTHRLRGCVGRIDSGKSLWETVHLTAADVISDPRFVHHQPVKIDEAPNLEIEISVLSPPHPAASALDFDLLQDGIYLIYGSRAGFFLPQVARDTGWTKEQLLARLCTEKLGLPADTWQRPDAKLFTFKVEVIGPEPV